MKSVGIRSKMKNNTINIVYRNVDKYFLEQSYDSIFEKLYPARRQAIRKLKNKNATYVSMTAGLLLQEIAMDVLGLLPEKILIEKNEHGKPFIQGQENFKYNISHSGDMVMLAYSTQELGADIEKLRDKDIRVAKRCFCKSEYDYVIGSPQDDDKAVAERFFRVWTMKEAYLKYSGKGISVPLSSFEVDAIYKCVKGETVKYYTGKVDNYIYAICAEDVSDVRIEN